MATDINLDDLTNGDIVNGEWVGTGVFDVLMGAVNDNIKIQYDASRIKGTDYANVYMTSMQSVIAQSMQYLLQEKVQEAQADKIQDDITSNSSQRGLIAAQTAKVAEETLNTTKERDVMQAQIDKTQDAILTSTKQRDVLASQIALYDRQKDSFDDNKYQKLLEAQVNYHGMIFQDLYATDPNVLDISSDVAVNNVFNKIVTNDPVDPLSEVPAV